VCLFGHRLRALQGGSYSGKLAAYMRLKYPTIVDMALAASAPVFLDSPGFGNELEYYEVVTKATAKLSPKCPEVGVSGFARVCVCLCLHVFACVCV
jgi:hypothetical protein